MKCQSLFSGKNKKSIINFPSAQRVVKVEISKTHHFITLLNNRALPKEIQSYTVYTVKIGLLKTTEEVCGTTRPHRWRRETW